MILGKYIPDAGWDGKLFTQPFPLVHVAIVHRENVGKQSIHGPAHLGIYNAAHALSQASSTWKYSFKVKIIFHFPGASVFFRPLPQGGPLPFISRVVTTINGRK